MSNATTHTEQISFRPPSYLPESLTLWRGARRQGMKRYAWATAPHFAANFASLRWRRDPWRRGADESVLHPDTMLHVYELRLTRQQMLDGRLAAWITSEGGWGGYEEIVFTRPKLLPTPVSIGRINARGHFEEWDSPCEPS